MEKMEEMIEEIRTLDESGKESVEKLLKVLKKKKEGDIKKNTKKIVDVFFSNSAAGRLAANCRFEGIISRRECASVSLSANFDLGHLNQGILGEGRMMFWKYAVPVAGIKQREDEDLKDFSIAQYEMGKLEEHMREAEKVRIWYSNTSRDLCGLYYMCDYIVRNNFQGQVYYVICDNCEQYELDPDDKEFVSRLERILINEKIQKYQSEWKRLIEENSLLRIYKEGIVKSVSEDYYDDFIWRMFNENQLTQIRFWNHIIAYKEDFVGMESWFCYRIEKYIEEGKIAVVEEPKGKSRILARTELFPLSEEQICIREEKRQWEKVYDLIEEKLDEFSIDQLKKVLELINAV